MAASATLSPRLRRASQTPLWPLLSTGVVAVLVLLGPQFRGTGIQRLSELSMPLVALALVTVWRSQRLRAWSAGAVYLLMLTLFHFGWQVAVAFRLPLREDFAEYRQVWFFGAYVQEAMYLSLLAVFAFAAAYAWTCHLRGGSKRTSTPVRRVDDREYGVAGALFLGVGIVLYVGTLAIQAPQLLTLGASYDQYNATVGGSAVLAGAVFLLGFGLVLLAAAPPSRVRTAGLVAFLVYALFVGALGVRTAVLFPAAAAAVTAARHHRVPNGKRTLVVIIVGLAAVGLVRDTRSDGFSVQTLSRATLSPTDTLIELGGTLRGVSETVAWRRGWNEPPYQGSTYIAPLLRAKERLLGEPRPASNADARLAGTIIAERVKFFQIGYTPVAEAYLNFGTKGVLGFFSLLGIILARLDTSKRLTIASSAVVGVVMLVIGLQVRNASNAVPVTLILGFLSLFATSILVSIMWALNNPRRMQSNWPKSHG